MAISRHNKQDQKICFQIGLVMQALFKTSPPYQDDTQAGGVTAQKVVPAQGQGAPGHR